MAKPINDTPILFGKDAKTFFSKLEANKDKKVSKETIQSIVKNAAKLKSLLKHS